MKINFMHLLGDGKTRQVVAFDSATQLITVNTSIVYHVRNASPGMRQAVYEKVRAAIAINKPKELF